MTKREGAWSLGDRRRGGGGLGNELTTAIATPVSFFDFFKNLEFRFLVFRVWVWASDFGQVLGGSSARSG